MNFRNQAWLVVENEMKAAVAAAGKKLLGASTDTSQGSLGDESSSTSGPLSRADQSIGANALAAEEPPTRGPGPGIQTLNRARFAAMTPVPSAADRAAELSQQVAGGATPDVTNDLNRGRLSLDETQKILQHASQTGVNSLMDHVSLPDALSAAEVGTPDEKALLLPMIAQRMRAELPQIQNKTLQMKLGQRFQRLMREQPRAAA